MATAEFDGFSDSIRIDGGGPLVEAGRRVFSAIN